MFPLFAPGNELAGIFRELREPPFFAEVLVAALWLALRLHDAMR